MNSLDVFFFESIYSLSFLKWNAFSLNIVFEVVERTFLNFFLAFLVSDAKSTVIQIIGDFSPGFQEFSLSLAFRSLAVIAFDVDFFKWIYLV
jgi:hypothetical protein